MRTATADKNPAPKRYSDKDNRMHAPLNYTVFVVAAASFVLAAIRSVN